MLAELEEAVKLLLCLCHSPYGFGFTTMLVHNITKQNQLKEKRMDYFHIY